MDITAGPLEPVRVLSQLSRILAHAPVPARAGELCARHLAHTIADGCVVEIGPALAVAHRRAEVAASLGDLGPVFLHAHASSRAAYAQLVLDGARGRVTIWRDDGGPFRDAELELARACVDVLGLALAHHDVEDAEPAPAEDHPSHLQRLVATRDEFLSVASHELRTPITALGLQLDIIDRLLERHAALEDIRVRTAGAKHALAELTELLDHLLDVTRISAGKIALELARVDLRDVITDVCDRLAPQAQKAGCALAIELESVTGRWDRARVDQIATHLLENAIKYAPGAPVRVHLAPDGDRACLEVVDGGAGVALEHAQRVFEKFVRLTPDRDGLGLGLYVSRELARAHGGDIELDRAPGSGARFKVTLPRG